MLDFKELKKMKSEISAQQRQKKDARFEKYFEVGLNHLARAHDTHFRDKQLLILACENLINAITAHRDDIRPYLALTYLFTILEDFETAHEYLQAALHIDPENLIAQAFLDAIREQRTESLKNPAGASVQVASEMVFSDVLQTQDDAATSALDLDALYDALEVQIIKRVKDLSQLSPPAASPSRSELKELKDRLSRMENDLRYFCQQIEIVDEEIDTGELQQALRPYEMTLKRYQEIYEISRNMCELKRTLSSQTETVKQVRDEAEKTQDSEDLPILEENLEIFFDHCDEYADHLDTFEGQGYTSQTLVKAYEQLVQEVERLQEIVDDAMERLS